MAKAGGGSGNSSVRRASRMLGRRSAVDSTRQLEKALGNAGYNRVGRTFDGYAVYRSGNRGGLFRIGRVATKYGYDWTARKVRKDELEWIH